MPGQFEYAKDREIIPPEMPIEAYIAMVAKQTEMGKQSAEGEKPTTNFRKYEEMRKLGVDDDYAIGAAYGLFKESQDTRGRPVLIDLRTHPPKIIGTFVRGQGGSTVFEENPNYRPEPLNLPWTKDMKTGKDVKPSVKGYVDFGELPP